MFELTFTLCTLILGGPLTCAPHSIPLESTYLGAWECISDADGYLDNLPLRRAEGQESWVVHFECVPAAKA